MTRTRPRVLIFSEARFTVDRRGAFWSDDASVSDEGWKRELPTEVAPVLVARARSSDESTGTPVHGETFVLPHYVGLRQALMRLPATWRAIDRSMSGASLAIVKVPGMLGALATLSAMRRRVPTAAEVVGDAEGVLRSGAIGRAGKLLRPFVGAITRWVVRRAKAVRYVTDRQLQHQYPPSSGAVTFAFSDVVIAAAPRWQPKDDAAPRLVSIGSVDQLYKGHHLLIEALKGVREAFPDATLTVVGSGRRMPFLHEVVERNELGDAVLFPGYLSPAAEVESVLVDATLFVLPSLTEGMPRALVEAMALGVPAVASRVGGVPELLPPSATFAPGDVDGMAALIIDLHRSEERRRDLSEAGIAATRRFSASVRTQALREWQRALVRLAAGE